MTKSANQAVAQWAGHALRALTEAPRGLSESELVARLKASEEEAQPAEVRVAMSYLSFVGLVGWLDSRYILSRAGLRIWPELRDQSPAQIGQWVLEHAERELRRRPSVPPYDD